MSPSAPQPGCLAAKDVIHGHIVVKRNIEYFTFSSSSPSKKCWLYFYFFTYMCFHVLQTAHSHTSCVAQSKETITGLSLENRSTVAVLRRRGFPWEEKQKNKESSAPSAGTSCLWAWDMAAAQGRSDWTNSSVFLQLTGVVLGRNGGFPC